MVLCLLVPLWMGLTSTDTNPGLQGHFFFNNVFHPVINWFISLFALWGQLQAKRRGTTSAESSDQKVSIETRLKKEGFPSFTVEDLNGGSSQ